MPKQLVCVGQEKLEWREYKEPKELQKGHVRIENQYGTEKHGTMMSFYKGYGGSRGPWDGKALIHKPKEKQEMYPVVMGNMQLGTITEIGLDVHNFKVGDKVYYWGGFQPTTVIPEDRCLHLNAGVNWEDAFMLDPAEFALGAVRDGHVRIGDNVAIFGLGAIGLVCIQMAKLSGAGMVIAIDPLPNRCKAARQLKADHVLDPTNKDAGMILRDLTNGRGPDVVIDFSGSPYALQSAIRGVCYLGTIVCGAYPPPYTIGFDFGGEAHMNRPKIVFSRACSEPNPEHPRWNYLRIRQTCLELINSGKINGKPILKPIVPFDSLLDEYPKIPKALGTNIKLTVKY